MADDVYDWMKQHIHGRKMDQWRWGGRTFFGFAMLAVPLNFCLNGEMI